MDGIQAERERAARRSKRQRARQRSGCFLATTSPPMAMHRSKPTSSTSRSRPRTTPLLAGGFRRCAESSKQTCFTSVCVVAL